MRVQALSFFFFFLSLARCQPKENATFVDVPPPSGGAQMILPMASALPHVDNEPVHAPRTPVLFRAGDSVEVEWQQSWWPAHVLEVVTTFPPTYRIHYDGYGAEWDEDVGLDRIRTPE